MPSRGTILFREKQAFHLGYSRIALAIPPAALMVITVRQIVWHHPWQSPPMSNGNLLFLANLIMVVYAWLMAVRLVTVLRPDELSVRMRGLWQRARVPVGEIRAAAVVEYDALAEYRGYGVRSGPRGRGFLASGKQAVQVEMRDGSKLLIGSQRARELARAIVEAQRRLA